MDEIVASASTRTDSTGFLCVLSSAQSRRDESCGTTAPSGSKDGRKHPANNDTTATSVTSRNTLTKVDDIICTPRHAAFSILRQPTGQELQIKRGLLLMERRFLLVERHLLDR